MRIVLDTNVVISALLWQGTPHHLLDALRHRSGTQLDSSPVLLRELADVLERPFAVSRLLLIARDARSILIDCMEAVEVVEPTSVPRVVAHDADDDPVVALAVAVEANSIVSGDRRHLLSLQQQAGIAIVEPREALRQLSM